LLLDDPLSALDHSTAESIVRKFFSSSFMENRTVVLVTHRTSLVHQLANRFVEVSDGHIAVSHEDPFQNVDASGDLEEHRSAEFTEPRMANGKDDKDSSPQQIIEEEHREQGGIKAKVWLAFVKAGKYWWILLLLMMGKSSQLRECSRPY
jgi:energy-coupling factor transporter ATP-binding protein EcfA2